MSQSTTSKQEELLLSQTNTKETHKQNSSELIKRIKIQGTPFIAIKTETETEIILTYGKYKLTEHKFETIEEIIEYLEKSKWNIIESVIGILTDHIISNQKTK